ncbi:MAG: dihydrodipicolinate synthase family protein [Acidobacteriota bacterium]
METIYNRRQWLAAVSSAALLPSFRLHASLDQKPMRGAFIIMATPYSPDKKVDFEDLTREVDFMHRCGVQGMVWPQFASEYPYLKREERLKGMEVLAKAARGKNPALVLGVQADTSGEMLEFAQHAERLEPDAVIAMPPKKAKSLKDYRSYYRALCKSVNRTVFIQTTGGAPDVEPTVEFILEIAREFPHFGYIKEEYKPVLERMQRLAKYRPDPIKSVFSGSAGRGWPYEMRLGLDGTMPGAPYSDIYALLWSLYEQGKWEEIREVFSKLLLMINLAQQIPGVRQYIMKKRGVFKTTVSRRQDYTYTPKQIEEIEFNFAALKPYLRT